MDKNTKTNPVKRKITDWLKVLFLLLDEAAVVLLVIILLRFFKVQIPLPVVIILALFFGVIVFMIHRAVIPSFHWRPVSGAEGMIGTQGRVVEPLNPVGAVIVNGERWRAKSTEENIKADENVEIVELNGLTLRVKRKE